MLSPTISSDEKWDWVREQKFLAENKPLKKWLQQMIRQNKPDQIVQNSASGELQGLVNKMAGYTGKMDDDDFIEIGEDLDDAEAKLKEIMEDQKALIELLHYYGEPKYLADRVLVILDDLVGSKLFKRTGWFNGFITRHRHYGASVIKMTQGYKEVPKTVRTNSTCLLVYEIGNMKEIEVVYEEWPMGLRWDDWFQAYDYATKEEHNFLFINLQQPRQLRMMKNFDEFLFITPDDLPSYEEAIGMRKNGGRVGKKSKRKKVS